MIFTMELEGAFIRQHRERDRNGAIEEDGGVTVPPSHLFLLFWVVISLLRVVGGYIYRKV